MWFKRRLYLLSLVLLVNYMCDISYSVATRSYCITTNSCSFPEDQNCTSLGQLSQILESNSTVHFCAGRITIDELITFRDLTDIAFIGQESKTVIVCGLKSAGLKFSDVRNLMIDNLRIDGCGYQHDSTTQIEIVSNDTLPMNSAIYIINCKTVSIHNIRISNSNGTGLVLFDTNGVVDILDSLFELNTVRQNETSNQTAGGGGLYIEFTVCTPGVYCKDFANETENERARSSLYTIKNCKFLKNRAQFDGPKYIQYTQDSNRLDHQGLGRGGGLSILINGGADSNHLSVDNCVFDRNEAAWGGGLYIVIQDSAKNNVIEINKSNFSRNFCPQNGGGGVDLGFNVVATSNNTFLFNGCNFNDNNAMYGGGARMYSSHKTVSDLQNVVEFTNCNWTGNIARFGAAVDIAPHVWEILSSGFLPTPLFKNCIFQSNIVDSNKYISSMDQLQYIEYVTGRGTMMLTRFKVRFAGFVTFNGNAGSALYLSSSIVSADSHTVCHFTNNSAFEGGAIAFIGYSALFVKENSIFHFDRNTAVRRGGAIIAHTIDKHNFVSSRSCFIQYHGTLQEDKNVLFRFTHNFAGSNLTNPTNCYALGHSIFSSTLQTCIHACNPSMLHLNAIHNDTFSCVGKFIFTENIECEVSTSGGKFNVDTTRFNGPRLELFPGREIILPVSIENDFKQAINAVYYATIENNNGSNIKIKQTYTYISNRRIELNGQPGDKGVLKLQKLGFRDLIIKINVTLQNCPPGYVLWNGSSSRLTEKCICSASRKTFSYKSIKECDDSSFQANLQRGYWLGYDRNQLRYGYCPTGYCFVNNTHDIHHKLPSYSASKDDIDRMVCGEYRTGVLCGECRANYSVHYHGEHFLCENNDSCRYGWLLYIITELIPLTGIFVLATVFNISFTSGAVNGFILFAQVFDSFPITGKAFIIFPDAVYQLYIGNKMIYNLFNFNFFSHDKLSFCLWKGATAMDMLVFRFLTVVYATFLVVFTVWVMKYCNIFQRFPRLRFTAVKTSVIHGLSSVLVMVFSQCIKACFLILDSSYLFGKGSKYEQDVVFVQGNLVPFHGDHIKYAVIAIICLLIMIMPLLLLLIYPASFKLLKLFRCSDTNRVARALFHVPYSKLKPFLDSFQSCFKDDCRIFAGLYFVYRIVIIASTIVPRLTQQYVFLDVSLVLFLVIHAIAQPYRVRWHNILDGLLFFNLTIINKITRYNYDYSKFFADQPSPLPFTTSLQIIIINLPLLYMVVYVLRNIIVRIKAACRKKKLNADNDFSRTDVELPELRDELEESDSDDGNADYRPYNDVMFGIPSYTS